MNPGYVLDGTVLEPRNIPRIQQKLGIVAAGTVPAHAATHENGGSDQVNVAGLTGLLADPQTPLIHNIITAHNGFPGGGTTFLRDDGMFAVPVGGSGLVHWQVKKRVSIRA